MPGLKLCEFGKLYKLQTFATLETGTRATTQEADAPRRILKSVRLGDHSMIRLSFVSLKVNKPQNPFSLGLLDALVQERDSAKAVHQPAFLEIHNCDGRQTTEPYP